MSGSEPVKKPAECRGPRPVVGLTSQTIQPIPGQAPLSFGMGQQYVRVLAAAGAVPSIIPSLAEDESTLRAIFDRLDGLFLAGGVDIDPTNYAEPRRDYCGPSDAERDAVEIRLLQWAAKEGLPVLGVCRGVQMINVAYGGTLFQDLQIERSEAEKHDYFQTQGFEDRTLLVHSVSVSPGTRLHAIVGDKAFVNSIHHQGIKRLGDDLKSVAVSPDGVIEGIEGNNGRFLIGVQWHPEELAATDASMRRLFEAFVSEAAAYRCAARSVAS